MKKSLVFSVTLLLGLCIFTFSSCTKEDKNNNVNNEKAKPVINLAEVGNGNNKLAVAGSDLHVEGEITAENGIKRIDIEIHPAKGGEPKIVPPPFTEGKYIGVKNATFHEHIDIPATTPAGDYHLHFTVTDQSGQTATVESELKVQEAAKHITVEVLKFGASHDFMDNMIGYAGTYPLWHAHIKAENGIDKIHAAIHNESGTPAFNLDTIYYFKGETEWGTGSDHKHVFLPENTAPGDYHMHLDVYDKKGEISINFLEGIQFKKSLAEITGIKIGGTSGKAYSTSIRTEFNVKAPDGIYSIRLRIYKVSATKEYLYNETLRDEFSASTLTEYAFNKSLSAKDAKGEYIIPATGGEKCILEIRVNYAQGASKTIKQEFTLASA